jgi:hypothetical protein
MWNAISIFKELGKFAEYNQKETEASCQMTMPAYGVHQLFDNVRKQ